MSNFEEQVLPKLERARLREELEIVAYSFARQNPEVLIVLDRSARPLGLPMKKILMDAFGINVKLFFIRPSQAVFTNFAELKRKKNNWTLTEIGENNWKDTISQLTHEHPNLVKSVVGKRVVILDDQLKSGSHIKAIKKLVRRLGAKSVHGRALSIFPDKPVYS